MCVLTVRRGLPSFNHVNGSINSKRDHPSLPPPPRAFVGNFSFDFKIVANAPRRGFEKSLNDQPAEQECNNRSQMYFYGICNSSNRFLIAKTTTFSRTVHILLFVISCLQVETIVHVGVEPYATF